ncbi:MAG: adenylate/guanylate cyclase domain-containing protein [Mycobacterium sp.]|uniref:adenylate/guanylate cyclase domain-containing protein n=1 Tax=Mycobacterium sp. TaxID=1785 RepID=UPI001ED0A568|nr:adenylate/guanylate cyclase domain-containing protein [Mycobacterium sp.]MBW0018149.1 adenylate/guanylate cyclase domain-containing protein [Mycobacterium sp.]
MSGAVVPTVLGSVVIAVMTFWALPTGAALSEHHVLVLNIVAAMIYSAIAVPAGVIWGYFWLTFPAGADEDSGRHTLLTAPNRMAFIHGTVWMAATFLLVLINVRSPWLATTLGVNTVLGATVTTAVSYWLCTRALRPAVAELLTKDPPTRPRRPGLRMRGVSAWMVGTAVPLLGLMLVAASALVVDYPGHRLAVVVLGLGACALASGLAVAAFTAATTADPIDEVRRGMRQVQRGVFDVSVPVFDASELGLLQSGFNVMARGLRERERLRDLFGRHVGRDVARLAEQLASRDDVRIEMGGVNCEVAVLFIDLVGSTRLATTLDPGELVTMLNEFFTEVVGVVERNHGMINKFEGDAVLAIFGAPIPDPDGADHALATARELHLRFNRSDIKVGIGVSAGAAVAGNIGDPSRYEYTVIGDPVNEAARLTEVAKLSGGVAASGVALSRADESESQKWRVVDSKVLRGRDNSTDIAVPVT